METQKSEQPGTSKISRLSRTCSAESGKQTLHPAAGSSTAGRGVLLVVFLTALLLTGSSCADLKDILSRHHSKPVGNVYRISSPRSAPDGNASLSQSADAGFYAHRVRWPGETLSVISKWYTGDVVNWKQLAKANPDMDPDRIFVGETIRIPEKLLKTRKPLPHDFVMQYLPTPVREKAVPSASENTRTASPTAASPPESPLQLFGPKGYTN